jgi:hypothetical protein
MGFAWTASVGGQSLMGGSGCEYSGRGSSSRLDASGGGVQGGGSGLPLPPPGGGLQTAVLSWGCKKPETLVQLYVLPFVVNGPQPEAQPQEHIKVASVSE